MARRDARHPDNVEGDWYVDTRCIECDAARHYAPEPIASVGGQSVVATGRQVLATGLDA